MFGFDSKACIAACLTAAAPVSLCAGPIRFFVTPELTAGIAPSDITLTDLDLDGDLDALTADARDGASGSVTVLRNLGGARFSLPETYLVGADARSLAAADFTGDSRPDVAVCNYQDSTITILRNAGSTLAFHTNLAGGYLPMGLSAGDLDGDGDNDLVWVGVLGYVYVAMNRGDGNYLPATQYYTGVSPSASALGDLDRDGDLDIASVSYGSWSLIILKNAGNGTFTGPTMYTSYYYASDLTIRDFNGDLWPDIAVASGPYASVFLNSGSATFPSFTNYPVGENATGIACGDFDSDGLPDLATTNYLANSVTVLHNLGGGSFGVRHDWGTGMNPQGIEVGDVDGDGSTDILTTNANLSSSTVSLLLNTGRFSFAAREDFALKGYGFGITSSDFDRDGYADIAAPSEITNASYVSVFKGRGNGTLGERTDISIPYSGTEVLAEDFNRDGWADLAVSTFSPGNRILLFKNNGNGGFNPPTHHSVQSNALGLAAGDFNGDGWPDLAVANAAQTANTVSVLINDGSGSFLPEFRVAVGVRPVDVAVADVNHDGFDDVIVAHGVSQFLTVLRNTGSGSFSRSDIQVGTSQICVRTGDLDGDGDPDAAITDVGTVGGRVGVLFNTGGTLASPSWIPTEGAEGLTLGDLDNDSDLDIAFTSSYDRIGVLENLGTGSFGRLSHFRCGYDSMRLISVNLDRDGRRDLAIANSRARSVTVLVNMTNRQIPQKKKRLWIFP